MMTLMIAFTLAAEPVNFAFEDQFEKKVELKDTRGKLVVLVYGDRKGTDDCRKLGEKLHEELGDTALVQAVACCGKMPNLMRPLLRGQVAKASPTVPVWLDFSETMVTHFGLTTGQANVAVFDKNGRYRHLHNGTPTAKQTKELIQTLNDIKAER